MSRRKHIHDKDLGYTLFLLFVRVIIRVSYRRFHVSGWKNVPRRKDGSVILVTNHTGSLMDPMVMLMAEKHNVTFMARADVFRKPFVARLLRWLRILPIYRIRDGVSAVKENERVFDEAVGVLQHRHYLCLYPEGTHRTQHSLLRFGKGVFHMAIEADRRIGGEWPVYIVPAGIEYGDYFRFRPDVEVDFGEPINVTEFVVDIRRQQEKNGEEYNEARVINMLRDRLTLALRDRITWIPDDDDYDAIWELTQLHTARFSPLSQKERKILNKHFVGHMLKLREEEPERAAELFRRALAFRTQREAARVSVFSAARLSTLLVAVVTIIKTLAALVMLPVWLFCTAVSLPAWGVGEWRARRAKDYTWRNTWRFAACVIFVPIITILAAIFTFTKLAWLPALCFTLLTFLGVPVFYDGMHFMRKVLSDWHWLFRPALRQQLRELLDAAGD